MCPSRAAYVNRTYGSSRRRSAATLRRGHSARGGVFNVGTAAGQGSIRIGLTSTYEEEGGPSPGDKGQLSPVVDASPPDVPFRSVRAATLRTFGPARHLSTSTLRSLRSLLCVCYTSSCESHEACVRLQRACRFSKYVGVVGLDVRLWCP